MAPVRVLVQATDPVSRVGLTRHLKLHTGEIHLLDDPLDHDADVVVIGVGRMDTASASVLAREVEEHRLPVVLVTDHVSRTDLIILVRGGRSRSFRAAPSRPKGSFAGCSRPHRGTACWNRRWSANCCAQIVHLHRQPPGREYALTASELDLLRLLEDGFNANEIADELSYSKRAVKNSVQSALNRRQAVNRPHAVAHALRSGLI